MDKIEQTLLIVKPDAVRAKHVGAIIATVEEVPELSIVVVESMYWTIYQAEEFYKEHRGKSFFEELVTFMASDMLIAIVVEGVQAITLVRQLSGATKPEEAAPGTFRRRFGTPYGGSKNATHSSDSPEGAVREINLILNG